MNKNVVTRIREATGLNKTDFGIAVGWSCSQVTTYENGKRKPSLETVQRICDKVGVDIKNVL